MIAKARSISHGSAMTNYATKHNRADMVLTRNLGEGLTPLAMWGAMETIHQKYEPKFRRKPVTKPTLRMEVSPSLEETKGWTLKDWYDYAIRFLEEFKKEVQAKEGKSEERASSIWTEHRFSPVFTLMRSLAFRTCTSSSTASTLTGT